MFDRAKALLELKKIQTALAREIIEVEAGDGAVRIRINGEQKIKGVELDPAKIGDSARLEKWIESAITQAITRSQQLAADKMRSVTGGLGLPGM